MLDIPNVRSSHSVPTPRGGGLGLVLTFMFGSILYAVFSEIPAGIIGGVMLSSALIAIVGFVDDHYHLPAPLRLAAHILASVLFLYSVELNMGWLGYAVACFSMVWLLNLYNFMDGIDALAGAETVFVVAAVIFILWLDGGYFPYGPWLAVLGVAVGGFLVWNRPPAKIFMGDVGSGFLGFTLASFAILTSSQQGVNVWTWLILSAVFIVDATVTLLRRIVRGECFWKAHRSHAYQILSRRYCSHLRVTVAILAVNICWLLPWAVISARWPSSGFLCALAAIFPLLILALRIGAGTTNE